MIVSASYDACFPNVNKFSKAETRVVYPEDTAAKFAFRPAIG
jgi:hypothetical protein